MLKSLLSVCSIFVLLASTLLFPSRTSSCPVRLPETLLSLYRGSDAIYVAKFDKVVDGAIVENTDERVVVDTKMHFDVTAALKGDNRKLFVLDERVYRYKNNDDEVARGYADEEEVEAPDSDAGGYRANRNHLKAGDLLLIFVRKSEDGKSMILADWRDGIKKMTPERLDAYEARIRDLNSIFASKTVDDAAIVEWLVRTAEDPITRWEGAFDLRMSQEALELAEKEQKVAEEDEAEEGTSETVAVQLPSEPEEEVGSDQQAGEEDAAAEEEGPVSGFNDQTVWAKLLTDSHKQRLLNALTSGSYGGVGEKQKALSGGDRALVELVSNWGGNPLAKFLLDRMGSVAASPYVVTDLMNKIATLLDDDELDEISDQYSEVYYQDDDEFVRKEDPDESEKSESEDQSGKSEPESAAGGSNDEATPKLTYKELRQQLFSKFLERSVAALAIAESKEKDTAASR